MNRKLLLQVITGLLYIGPLVAGLAGFGWSLVIPFAAIFLLWQVVMRPLDWPREPGAWARREMQAAAAARILILVLLVALCFGIGRGLGGLAGHLPAMSPLLPFGISLLAIPLARLVWDPHKEAAMDALIDGALAQLRGPGAAEAAHLAAAAEKAVRLLRPIHDLPDDTPADVVASHLRAITPHVDPQRLREALLAGARRRGAGRAVQTALALHATEPALMDALGGDHVTFAFNALPDTPEVLALFARRTEVALAADPDLWWGIPSEDALTARIARLDGTEAAGALRELLATARRLAPEDRRG